MIKNKKLIIGTITCLMYLAGTFVGKIYDNTENKVFWIIYTMVILILGLITVEKTIDGDEK